MDKIKIGMTLTVSPILTLCVVKLVCMYSMYVYTCTRKRRRGFIGKLVDIRNLWGRKACETHELESGRTRSTFFAMISMYVVCLGRTDRRSGSLLNLSIFRRVSVSIYGQGLQNLVYEMKGGSDTEFGFRI